MFNIPAQDDNVAIVVDLEYEKKIYILIKIGM